MSTFKNFVQCRVTSPITAAADSIGLYAVVPPYSLPSEEGGLLVLTDSPNNPSKLEVISYTSRSALGLYGVTRGLEGTTAQAWTGPVYCYQSLLAGEFKTLLDSKVDKVTGKGLSDTNFTQAEKTKLTNIAVEATKNRADSANADKVHTHTTAQVTGLDTTLGSKASKTELTDGLALKVDKEVGKGLSDTNFTQVEKTKLADIASEATKNRADSLNADKVHTHTWSQVTEAPESATRWPTFAEVTGKPIVQTVGTSTTDIMSQKAITEALEQVGGGNAILTPGWTLTRNNIGDGYAAQDGQLLSRATYPDAWAQAQAIGMVITDAEWLADPLKRGFFSSGNGSTTFRLPDANGKQAGSLGAVVLRGDGALSTGQAGLIQRDAMQRITGWFNGNQMMTYLKPLTDGAFFHDTTKPTNAGTSGAQNTQYGIAFDSGLSPGARVSDAETRPLNLTVVWTIKLFGAVVNVGSADAAQLASDYANLASALQTFESRYDSEVDFTIIYPNGGMAASPANVAINSLYVEDNPFPGRRVICEVEIQIGGVWGAIDYDVYGSAGSVGVYAALDPETDKIKVLTGIGYFTYGTSTRVPACTFSATTSLTTPVPCRVLVWKVKGALV